MVFEFLDGPGLFLAGVGFDWEVVFSFYMIASCPKFLCLPGGSLIQASSMAAMYISFLGYIGTTAKFVPLARRVSCTEVRGWKID